MSSVSTEKSCQNCDSTAIDFEECVYCEGVGVDGLFQRCMFCDGQGGQIYCPDCDGDDYGDE